MFDHITIRVPEFEATAPAWTAALAALELAPTSSTPAFAVWPTVALGPVDADHEPTRRAHIAFVAPTQDHVEAFWRAAIAAGFTDDGAPGPRPDYAEDYYAAFVRDAQGNSLEAVHRASARPEPPIEHVALRVADLDAAVAFYTTVGDAVGLTLARQSPERATFTTTAGTPLSLVGGPPTEHLHLAFAGHDADVQRFHALATEAGYRSNGEPRERPQYHPGFYAAYVLDPDGNNVEVVDHHRP
jgi:catechol 2,3-dioxygenase-like lactoylglutathione lyase family enzyme